MRIDYRPVYVNRPATVTGDGRAQGWVTPGGWGHTVTVHALVRQPPTLSVDRGHRGETSEGRGYSGRHSETPSRGSTRFSFSSFPPLEPREGDGSSRPVVGYVALWRDQVFKASMTERPSRVCAGGWQGRVTNTRWSFS